LIFGQCIGDNKEFVWGLKGMSFRFVLFGRFT